MSAEPSLTASPSSAIEPRVRRTWLQLLQSTSTAELETLLRNGSAPSFESIVGWEWKGGNAFTLAKLLGIRRFTKGFYEGPARSTVGPTPFVQGYNVDVRRGPDDGPHQLLPSDDAPKRFGFYRVHAPVPGARDSYYPNALLLDYGLGGNGIFGPPLRDYVVQPYADEPDLLLGKAYLALAGLRIPSNFFILERLRPHSFKG